MLLQMWSSYTMNGQVFDPTLQTYQTVDNRFNLWFRRAIVGFKAEPFPGLRFKLMTAYDGLGKDLYAGANGSVNNSALANIGILEAYAQWQIWPGHETFHLTAGYFRPQIGRESMTSSWGVSSMDRALNYTYLRKQLTGNGFGRTTGINLGGLIQYPGHDVSFEYGLGLFTPQFGGENGSSMAYAPLLTARAAISFGDPEMETYQVYRKVNFLSARRGLTLAANGAWQGANDLFENSSTLSADVLFNWDKINIDGEWSFFWRDGERALPDDQLHTFTYYSNAAHVRASYNFSVAQKYTLEPNFTYMFFSGAKDGEGQADALAIGSSSGRDYGFDAGLNWYIHGTKAKLQLHYNWRKGNTGDAGPGSKVNYYYYQSGVGAIQRGNWLGLGLNLAF